MGEKRVLTVDDFEHNLMLNGINEYRNMLLEQELPTDDVDDLLLKFLAFGGTIHLDINLDLLQVHKMVH